MKDTLYIYRSTWGYLRAEVETEGDFLEVDKKIITSEDSSAAYSAWSISYCGTALAKGNGMARSVSILFTDSCSLRSWLPRRMNMKSACTVSKTGFAGI